jgi:deoxyribodipyrimidine photo-lyase
LKRDLEELGIPLHVETVQPRRDIPGRIVELMKSWHADDIFANIEYEVDELDRDKNLIMKGIENEIRTTFVHDQCVVEPGIILSAVFPFVRS